MEANSRTNLVSPRIQSSPRHQIRMSGDTGLVGYFRRVLNIHDSRLTLDYLPPEVIQQILGHLPTAASIINLARTNRKLYTIISADDYGVFRDFVQRQFPSIRTPPLWRAMACTLTFRSRAWDRKAFIARECLPPNEANNGRGWLGHAINYGFVPAIDSYEEFPSNVLAQKKEVLAIGTAGRLRLRTVQDGRTEWQSLQFEGDHLPQHDIMDIKLLRPHQHQLGTGETIIFRRANAEITKVVSTPYGGGFAEVTKFDTNSMAVHCSSVSDTNDPLLVVCNPDCLRLYPVQSTTETTPPSAVLSLAQTVSATHRQRCVQFLTADTIAVGVQHLEGRERAPILIYDLHAGRSSHTFLEAASSIDADQDAPTGRYGANTIASLDGAGSSGAQPGQVFLSGWTDGVTRLHDLRRPQQVVSEFVDHVDDGQIMSILPFGHEKFFAGSHQNACLKMFDLRIPGARRYSYLDVSPQDARSGNHRRRRSKPLTTNGQSSRSSTRGINIFLAIPVARSLPRGRHVHNRRDSRDPKYRGPIYSLSSPSASSPTVYAGILNDIIRLDFCCTEDIRNQNGKHLDSGLGLSTVSLDDVLDLSCYERPRKGHEANDPVLLRKQINWKDTTRGIQASQYGEPEDGWDERWRMSSFWKTYIAENRRQRGQHT